MTPMPNATTKRDVLISIVTGILLMVILMAMTDGPTSRLAYWCLSPGGLLASIAGLGAHDLGAYFFYGFGNAALYSLLCYIIMRLCRQKTLDRIASRWRRHD
jgi:hypothetical protein